MRPYEHHEPLTPEQLEALQAFAAKRGTRWKSALRNAWMSGGNEEGASGELKTLRNTHGPRWLEQFRLSRPVLKA